MSDDKQLDERTLAVFDTAVRELGGALQMARRHELAALPALMESASILVLANDGGLEPNAVADRLGVSLGAVESVCAAPMEAAQARLHYRYSDEQEFVPHTDPDWSESPAEGRQEPEFDVGAVAKFAYDVVTRQQGRIGA